MSAARARLRLGRVLAVVAGCAVVLWAERAPADIQEQRNRLPPPATTCTDPIEGVWMSHAYYPNQQSWAIFRLTVRRKHGSTTELEGQIDAEFWDASPQESNPPPCRPGLFHATVIEPAQGTISGAQIAFWGTSWRTNQVLCGGGGFSYNLDRFTGAVDPAILEFQSILDDRGDWVGEPTVFRRIRCIDPAARPHATVSAPPFQPPTRGCGC